MKKLSKLSFIIMPVLIFLAGCDSHVYYYRQDTAPAQNETYETEPVEHEYTREVVHHKPQTRVVHHTYEPETEEHVHHAPSYKPKHYVKPATPYSQNTNNVSLGQDAPRAQQTLSQMRKIINQAKQIKTEAEAKYAKGLLNQHDRDAVVRHYDSLNYYANSMSGWERDCDRMINTKDRYGLGSFVARRISDKATMEITLRSMESLKSNWRLNTPKPAAHKASSYTGNGGNAYSGNAYSGSPKSYSGNSKNSNNKQKKPTAPSYTAPTAPVYKAPNKHNSYSAAPEAPMSKNQQKRAIRKAGKDARRELYRSGAATPPAKRNSNDLS